MARQRTTEWRWLVSIGVAVLLGTATPAFRIDQLGRHSTEIPGKSDTVIRS